MAWPSGSDWPAQWAGCGRSASAKLNVLLSVIRERENTCSVSYVALDPGSCTARDPRRCGAAPEHFTSGLHECVELRLPPEGAIGVFSFC